MTETEERTDGAVDVDAIEARAAAATPGPWWITSTTVCRIYGPDAHERRNVFTPSLARVDREPDAAFIANAPVDVPALVAEVRRLRTDLAAVIATKGDDWQTGYETGCEMSHSIGCDSVQGERDYLRTELERTEGDWAVAIREAAQCREALRAAEPWFDHTTEEPEPSADQVRLLIAAALDKRLAPETEAQQ